MPNNALMKYRRGDALIPIKYCFGLASLRVYPQFMAHVVYRMFMIPRNSSGTLSVGDPMKIIRSAPNPRVETKETCLDENGVVVTNT